MDRLPLNPTHQDLDHGEFDDEDVSDYSESTDSLRKPANSLSFEEHHVEEASPRRQKSRYWWQRMVMKLRRKVQLDELNGVTHGLLADEQSPARTSKTKRSCYNYCIFGGIGGSTILMFLLLINLFLGIAAMWAKEQDNTLGNWGKPGSGTEGLAWYPTDFTRDVLPIPCHSHNDYWRKVPLFSALRVGCTGVESDVWLFDNDLYVGHNTASLTRNRTFQTLYIDPLVKILQDQNPSTDFYNGSEHGVFDADSGKPLTLLVDVKTSGEETWPWVLKQLQPLRERGWLSFTENDIFYPRQITVVGTGNTPFDVLTQNSTYRDAFFDAPLDTMWEPHRGHKNLDEEDDDDDLDEPSSSSAPSNVGQGLSGVRPTDSFNETNSYYASVSFNKGVGRLWRGHISQKQLRIIRGQVRGAHRRGLKARYWDLPAWPLSLRNHVWEVLVREGVDVLNVDDLRSASKLKWEGRKGRD